MQNVTPELLGDNGFQVSTGVNPKGDFGLEHEDNTSQDARVPKEPCSELEDRAKVYSCMHLAENFHHFETFNINVQEFENEDHKIRQMTEGNKYLDGIGHPIGTPTGGHRKIQSDFFMNNPNTDKSKLATGEKLPKFVEGSNSSWVDLKHLHRHRQSGESRNSQTIPENENPQKLDPNAKNLTYGRMIQSAGISPNKPNKKFKLRTSTNLPNETGYEIDKGFRRNCITKSLLKMEEAEQQIEYLKERGTTTSRTMPMGESQWLNGLIADVGNPSMVISKYQDPESNREIANGESCGLKNYQKKNTVDTP